MSGESGYTEILCVSYLLKSVVSHPRDRKICEDGARSFVNEDASRVNTVVRAGSLSDVILICVIADISINDVAQMQIVGHGLCSIQSGLGFRFYGEEAMRAVTRGSATALPLDPPIQKPL